MKLSLVDTLLEEGLIDERQLAECRETERETGQPLDRILKTKGFVSEENLLEVLSKTLRLPLRGELEGVEVPTEFVQKVPAQFARNYNLVGVARENGTYQVATCDPLDFHPMDDLAALLSATVIPVLAPR
ncbi:MAG: hypothetical protein O7J95_20455, partial [Planctomycetota bacterium]|nr:hypothetical protein [Planctomycetota bacterium]